MSDHLHVNDIANICGVNAVTVRRWVKRDGLTPASRQPMRFDATALRAWLTKRSFLLPSPNQVLPRLDEVIRFEGMSE